jgi:hypothetical protein
MRSAYSSRAAAYDKNGQHEKALADHMMAVTYYAIEVEILNELEAPDRAKVLAEAADAYLARGKCLEALARLPAAALDRKRAEALQAQAKPQPTDTVPADHVRIINAWTAPVTVALDSATYRIEAGTRKDIPLPAESVTCQLRTGPYLQTATLRAGKSYSIR